MIRSILITKIIVIFFLQIDYLIKIFILIFDWLQFSNKIKVYKFKSIIFLFH